MANKDIKLLSHGPNLHVLSLNDGISGVGKHQSVEPADFVRDTVTNNQATPYGKT